MCEVEEAHFFIFLELGLPACRKFLPSSAIWSSPFFTFFRRLLFSPRSNARSSHFFVYPTLCRNASPPPVVILRVVFLVFRGAWFLLAGLHLYPKILSSLGDLFPLPFAADRRALFFCRLDPEMISLCYLIAKIGWQSLPCSPSIFFLPSILQADFRTHLFIPFSSSGEVPGLFPRKPSYTLFPLAQLLLPSAPIGIRIGSRVFSTSFRSPFRSGLVMNPLS